MTDIEREALAAAVERLIPGAGAAGVPAFVERQTGPDGPLREGICRLADGGFATLRPEEQDAVLAGLEGDGFFETLRLSAVRGMFSDPRHGGNADAAGWALLGYPGPKQTWSADEQQIRSSEKRRQE